MIEPLHTPGTIEEIQEIVRTTSRIMTRGGGTKPALSTSREGMATIELQKISGVTEYKPEEYTITALAGTRLEEVNKLLSSHGQFFPFDPPLVKKGATLGGTVAAGLSGPGRYQYGGVRDFLLGVKYVDSQGRLIRTGGKVVKNVAGYDLAKLMVGSLGQYGVLVELTFKAFPQPEAFASLYAECTSLSQAMERVYKISTSSLEINAIDIVVGESTLDLWVRMGGIARTLPSRMDRLSNALGGGEMVSGLPGERFWGNLREMAWVPAGWSLIKVPLTPGRILAFDAELKDTPCLRHYSAGGQVAWVAMAELPNSLHESLITQGFSGLVLFGKSEQPLLGRNPATPFAKRIKTALDPSLRFVEA